MTALEHRKRLPSADRRQQILSAGAQLFVERGYEAVTMGDIATALGISRPTIYSYFTSTEAILDALLNERLDHLRTRLEPLITELRPQATEGPTVVETVFRFLVKERETLALLHSGGGPLFQSRRRMILNELANHPQFDPGQLRDTNPYALTLITTLLDSLAFRAIMDPTIDEDALARTLGAFVRNGIPALQQALSPA